VELNFREQEEYMANMAGRMIDFDAGGSPAQGYLAIPDGGLGPGVVVLHAWWGLTEPFRQVCDRLAEAGFIALAPDLYHGKTTASVAEAELLGAALDAMEEQWRGDIRGALRYLRQDGATRPEALGHDDFGLVAFSLGGAYAFDTSVQLAEEIAAVAVFYDAYPGLDYGRARAAYLCHYAENDSFVPVEKVEHLERGLHSAGRRATFYTYPGTRHSFFESNLPDAFDPSAAALAWERTVTFLNAELRRS
jgi:carboxymethylenebutenolidase